MKTARLGDITPGVPAGCCRGLHLKPQTFAVATARASRGFDLAHTTGVSLMCTPSQAPTHTALDAMANQTAASDVEALPASCSQGCNATTPAEPPAYPVQSNEEASAFSMTPVEPIPFVARPRRTGAARCQF